MAARRVDAGARSAHRVWQPATSVFEEPVILSRLIIRYVVTGLVALVAVAVVTAYVSRSLGVQEAVTDATRVTSLVASVAVEPVLTDGVLTGDPAALAAVDRVVREDVIKDELLRVKIWTADGTIVYSDESRLIGQQFTLDEEELDVLAGASAAGELSDLSEPENRFESRATELLEVYAPAETTGGTPVLFEAYFSYDGVTAAGRDVWLRFAPFSLGALVLLELLQVPLALSLARRLRSTQYQREELLRRAIEATDEERRRIASDLHDGVVQDLAGVSFSLAAIARDDGVGKEVRTAEITASADRVRDAVRSLRSLLVEIYPPNLYEEGLEAALSDLLVGVEARGVRTSLVVDAPLSELPLDVSQLMYRVGQEGLRNVVSHADASQVDVSVVSTPTSTVMEVVDDGRGLDGGTPPQREGHLGLKALSGLAASMGASLSISSTPGKGTALSLEVPHR